MTDMETNKPTTALKNNPKNYRAMSASPYNGASDKRSLVDWLVGFGDADAEILNCLQKLRDRSRDLTRNAPAATGAIEKLVAGVIGSGLRLQPSIDREFLRLTEEQAQAWQEKAQYEFRIWSESKDCDYARQLNFIGLQRLAFREKLTNGDCFVLLPYKTGGVTPYGLRVQLIEAERVVNNNDAADSVEVAGGIERAANGTPKAIFIRTPHPGATLFSPANIAATWRRVPFYGERTGRRNVLHLVDINRIGQSRGVPILAPVIETLKQVTKYSEAELSAAVINAMLAVFIKRPATDTTTVGGVQYEPGQEPWNRDDNLQLGVGTWIDGAPGEELSVVNAERPSDRFDPFFTACMKQIGMALGIPFEVLVGQFDSSYSASRAALLEFGDTVMRMRDDFADNFNQPIYEEFLAEAITSGRIKAPGFFTDPMVKLAYCGAYWVGDSGKQIDEVKEANAAMIRIKGCMSTLQIECSKRGVDYKDILRQRGEEKKLAEKYGLKDEYNSAFDVVPTIQVHQGGDNGQNEE